MKRKIIIVISIILIFVVAVGSAYLIDKNRMNNNMPVVFSTWGYDYAVPEVINVGKINIVTSLEDKLQDNSAWCGTFNLIWNDLKNDLAKQDIKFAGNSDIVDNLNKGTFTTDELSESGYYKTYGTPTLELKLEIEKAIKEKFNETSDILDSFSWNGQSEKDYFLYSMLKKDFEYAKEFDKLTNGTFGEYNNVKYFGITGKTKAQVREQVEVLYYNSEDDFALKIQTKGDDEIIVSVGNKEDNFLDIYNSIMSKSENYKDGKRFRNSDTFKMPYITFDLKEEITEVENKPFYFSDGNEYIIQKALQTIQFELDEKGGRVKSEAGMSLKATSAAPQEPRRFNVDKTFTIFLIEHGKELPYFAAEISDISSVQSGVEINENYNEYSNEFEIKYKDYKKVSTLHSETALTTMLVRYDGNLYGRSFSIIDYAPNPDGAIGVIDKLIDSEYVPKYNGETNTEGLLNAKVDSKGETTLVLNYNNSYVLYEIIEE